MEGITMRHFENQDDCIDPFVLLMLTILTLSGVLWLYPSGLSHWGWQPDLSFSTQLLTAVVQSSLVGGLAYCLALAYLEDDASTAT